MLAIHLFKHPDYECVFRMALDFFQELKLVGLATKFVGKELKKLLIGLKVGF